MVFENGVKNIQAAAYNGARTVFATKLTLSQTIKSSFQGYIFKVSNYVSCKKGEVLT